MNQYYKEKTKDQYKKQIKQSELPISPSTVYDKLLGQCYCGNTKFKILIDPPPYKSLYCHCQSCRRAHSAPLYQICYIPKQNFIILQGEQNIIQYKRQKQGAPIRAFCKICGSRVYNKLPAQPQLGIGFFPALLKEQMQRNLPQQFKPKLHYLSHEAILKLENIDDGLDRT